MEDRDQGKAGRGEIDPVRWAREVATIVDPLLVEVWAFLWARGEEPEDGAPGVPVEVLLRMAYLEGYRDALEEPVRGELFSRFGVEVPPARKTARAAPRARRSPEAAGSSDS